MSFVNDCSWDDPCDGYLNEYLNNLQVAFYICFIPESDNEGQLFLSTTDNPDDKILICRVGKDHETLPMQFRKYVYCLDIDLYFKTKMIMIHFH